MRSTTKALLLAGSCCSAAVLVPGARAFAPVVPARRLSPPSVVGIRAPSRPSALSQSSRSDSVDDEGAEATTTTTTTFSYGQFAQENPLANNLLIATCKTAAADLLAQTLISGTPVGEVDWARVSLFMFFGLFYLGGFQYLYQVQIFKRMFDVDSFTNQSWGDKLRDGPGLRALAAQTALDMTVLTLVYLPTFYIFKAGVFSDAGLLSGDLGAMDPSSWVGAGIENFENNFAKDEFDLARVWIPADLVCFSVPLYLRLPVRHVVSFVWTAYLSFARGGH
mmetsp:Transcript_3706/g.9953  ORF Transcript_3706/g.9953 Transcript_3706/m.9953 type:complete len:279 (-) Transcript_3706:348-1184(-)